jgi:hypothetical protein
MKKSQLITISVIVLLVVAGGSFYAGSLYGKSQSKVSAYGSGTFQTRINRGSSNGSNFISGSIIAKDSSSITLQLSGNSGSKIIFYSDTTQIGKMASGTADDLAAGTNVSVTGTTNSDGSVTAQTVQIRPAVPASEVSKPAN